MCVARETLVSGRKRPQTSIIKRTGASGNTFLFGRWQHRPGPAWPPPLNYTLDGTEVRDWADGSAVTSICSSRGRPRSGSHWEAHNTLGPGTPRLFSGLLRHLWWRAAHRTEMAAKECPVCERWADVSVIKIWCHTLCVYVENHTEMSIKIKVFMLKSLVYLTTATKTLQKEKAKPFLVGSLWG